MVFSYAFDGVGNRIRQSLNDCLPTRFVYDGPNMVLELNASNEVIHAVVNGPGVDRPIERIAFIHGTPRHRHVFHADGLGSIVALTDEIGGIIQTYAYNAFGSVRAQTGSDLNRVTFTAREALGDSLGFYYYRNRILDSNTGRFTSEDRLGFIDGPNRYVNVINNPVNWIDPTGLWFGVDDCFTGPVDEILVIAVASLLAYAGVQPAQDLLNAIGDTLFDDADESQNDAVDGAGNACPSGSLTPTGASKTEPSTKKGNKGGCSVQDGYKDCQGRDVTKHTVYGPNGKVISSPHFRPGGPK